MRNRYSHMLARGAVLYLMFWSITFLHAQESDSSLVSPKANVVVLDSMSTSAYAMMKRHTVWVGDSNIIKPRIVSSTFQFDKGDLMPATGSDRTLGIALESEGYLKWKDVDFWGSFKYVRQYEDSTRFRHQTRINESAPLFFGSLASNHYERSVYAFQATAQNRTLRRMPITIGFDYRVGDHFSNNDPRGKLDDFQLNTTLGIGYLPSSNLEMHATVRYGYGRERAQIAYKRVSLDRTYISWFMNGYGNGDEKTRDVNYNDSFQRFGLGAHMKYTLANSVLWGNISWNREIQTFKQDHNSELTYILFNTYQLNTLTGDLLWRKQIDIDSKLGLSFQGLLQHGTDDNPQLGAINYVHDLEKFMLKANYRKGAKEFVFGIAHEYMRKQDGVVDLDLDHQHINIDLAAMNTFNLSSSSLLLGLKAGYMLAYQNNIHFSAINQNYFNSKWIYNDFLYNGVNKLKLGILADLRLRSRENYTISLFFDNEVLLRNGDPDLENWRLGYIRNNHVSPVIY